MIILLSLMAALVGAFAYGAREHNASQPDSIIHRAKILPPWKAQGEMKPYPCPCAPSRYSELTESRSYMYARMNKPHTTAIVHAPTIQTAKALPEPMLSSTWTVSEDGGASWFVVMDFEIEAKR